MRAIMYVTPAAVMVAAMFLIGSSTVAALDRVDGEFWQYEFTMYYDGTTVEGLYTVTVVEEPSLEIAGNDYAAQVLSVRGTFQGTDSRVVPVSIEGGLLSTTCEIGDDLAVAWDESVTWANLTYDFGSEVSTVREESMVTRHFSPFWFSGFDTDDPALSESWVETLDRTTTIVEVLNGNLHRNVSRFATVSYLFEVGDSFERCDVMAGDFDALEIKVTSGDGAVEVYWWSEEAEYFVKQELYIAGDSDPYFASELREYELKSDAWLELYVIVGVIAAVVAVAILGLVLMQRSRFATVRETDPRRPPKDQPGHPPGS